MTQASKLISPLEAEYAEHREAEERRRDTREWLKQRERELGFVKDAPSVAPKTPER
jgi:septal ring factor EnvC (AmiA/AmiB activator)